MLARHAPQIRVMTFMGQASAGKGVKGFTQKEQLEVETSAPLFLSAPGLQDNKEKQNFNRQYFVDY